jgi:hypothetical protein
MFTEPSGIRNVKFMIDTTFDPPTDEGDNPVTGPISARLSSYGYKMYVDKELLAEVLPGIVETKTENN